MKQYKPRDKVTQKITREGAVEENQTTGKSENISGKEKEADFSQCHLDKDCFIVRNSYTADKHFVYLLYFYLITLLT